MLQDKYFPCRNISELIIQFVVMVMVTGIWVSDRKLYQKNVPLRWLHCAGALHLPTPSPLVALTTIKGGLTARGKERRGTGTNHMTAPVPIISVFGWTSFVLGLRVTPEQINYGVITLICGSIEQESVSVTRHILLPSRRLDWKLAANTELPLAVNVFFIQHVWRETMGSTCWDGARLLLCVFF